MNNLNEKELISLWKDDSFSGSFQSARIFQNALLFEKKIHIPLKDIYKALSKIPEYLLLIKPIRNFERRSYDEVHGFFKLVQADVAIMYPFKGFKNFLIVVDVFSHHIFIHLMKSKSKKEVIEGFQKIFDRFGNPEECQTDSEREFTCNETKKFFFDRKIYLKAKKNELKCSYAEWGIYRIKKLLYTEMYSKKTRNWPKIISNVVQKINDTPSPSLNNLKPSDLSSPLDDWKLEKHLKPGSKNTDLASDFQVGDIVILDNPKKNFEKSYKPRVSKKIIFLFKEEKNGLFH